MNSGTAVDEDVEIREFVREWFARRKDRPYDKLSKDLHHSQQTFLTALAEELSGPLNNFLSKMSALEPLDKQWLAKRINAEIHGIGLSIKCPKTGQPAYLIFDRTKNIGGRFRHEILASDGTRRRTTTTADPPTISLMLAEPTTDGRSSWIQRSRPKIDEQPKER